MKEKEQTKKKDSKSKEDDLTETVQRLQADFENYKKRVEKQNLEFKNYAKKEFVAKLLPTLDSFEFALKNNKDHEEFVKGVELLYSQLFQTLSDMGLRPIKAEGKLDPFKHDVLLTQESDKEEGTILEELQKGYFVDDSVIRHSKVKVAKSKPEKNKNSAEKAECVSGATKSGDKNE